MIDTTSAPQSPQRQCMARIAQTYNQLNADTLSLELLASLYHPDVEFIDPLHRHQGLPQLLAYFTKLYANVRSIRFEFDAQLLDGDQGLMTWTMIFSHPKLKKGQAIQVAGASHLRFAGDKVIVHRDYFDAGAMLYQHLPLIGRVIHWLKKRMS